MYEKFMISEEDKQAIVADTEEDRNSRTTKNGGFDTFNKFMTEALFNESPCTSAENKNKKRILSFMNKGKTKKKPSL